MQKGIATLEIILAIMIIGVLMKFAVPKAAQLIDAAALDYETKRFYSELRFVQTMGKSTPNSPDNTSAPILFIDCTENYYQVFKSTSNDITQAIREPHYSSHGVTIRLKDHETAKNITVNFDSEGKAHIKYESFSLNSGSLKLTSRLGKNKYIVIDSVGRIRGSLNK